MYIYQINVLLEHHERPHIEAKLEEALQKIIVEEKIDAEVVSSRPIELTGKNIGRCTGCGCWVSDHTKENAVREVSNGACIRDTWLCDICLPADHPNAF